MAKRTTPSKPVAEPDTIDQALLALAETLLSEYFFDPENEQTYKRTLANERPSGNEGVLLEEEAIEVPGGDAVLRIEALRTLTRFRVGITHPAFTATVEGSWSFDNEELSRAGVTRTGDPMTVLESVNALIEIIDGRELDDEEFADFLADLEDDADAPMIGDDPTEPPEATPLDRNRLKAIAKRVARHRQSELNTEDREWLEQTPQMLPAITEALISTINAPKRDEKLVLAYQQLLSTQLEFVRYRQDRGWDWANTMLRDFQDRLVEIGKANTIPRDDWFRMGAALNEARVPVDDDVQTALADAGFKPEDVDGPPEQMTQMMRHFMSELAQMVSSPFDVISALQGSGAMLPAMLRSFLATELALSPHSVLRDAVPLLLLDGDAGVRAAAAGALEQIAIPETMSSDSLRRAITIRNWIPVADRSALDAAIRKARLAGVEIGAWPAPARDLELYASIIDGSGAQSILAASRVAKKGLFAGLLLRHGTGVVDGWVDLEATRGQIGKMLREAQMAAPCVRVDMAFVSTVVQHAIAASAEQGAVPPVSFLEAAEVLGGAEWKDRRIDIKAEADQLVAALDPADRTPNGIAAGLMRCAEWMSKEDIFGAWFEDGPQVQKVLAKFSRTDRAGMAAAVMSEILPPNRERWAERYLILALWCQASADAKQRARVRDVAPVAQALAGDASLESLPPMGIIAAQTVRAMLLGNW